MDLTILDTKFVETELMAALNSNKRPGTHFWIGGTNHKSPSPSQFYWAKTEMPIRQDLKWGGNEPDDLSNQKCMNIYEWGSRHNVGNGGCWSENYALCQKTENVARIP